MIFDGMREKGSPSASFVLVRRLRQRLIGDGNTITLLRRSAQAFAFWSAIALPFLYLPLLAYGLETTSQLGAFFLLLVANVLALLVGHRYRAGR